MPLLYVRPTDAVHATQRTFGFFLRQYDEPRDFVTSVTFADGDIDVYQDGASTPYEVDVSAEVVQLGSGPIFELTLPQAEVDHGRINVAIVDQTATKVWCDDAFSVDLWGETPNNSTVPIDIVGGSDNTTVGQLLRVNQVALNSVSTEILSTLIDLASSGTVDASPAPTVDGCDITETGGNWAEIDGGIVGRPLIFIPTTGGSNGQLTGKVTRVLTWDETLKRITYRTLSQAPVAGDKVVLGGV